MNKEMKNLEDILKEQNKLLKKLNRNLEKLLMRLGESEDNER